MGKGDYYYAFFEEYIDVCELYSYYLVVEVDFIPFIGYLFMAYPSLLRYDVAGYPYLGTSISIAILGGRIGRYVSIYCFIFVGYAGVVL